MIGSKLVNRYQILERIGGGGMAIVYKARCTLLNRIVAVKILRQQYSIDEDFVRRFRREAQAAASLSHPNIVSIYDVGQDKETYFIVMEYVEGETLKELIDREAPLEPSRAVNIVRQIANALYHAHNNKIIHRDIKPHNVLISRDGRVKVADFGIARAVSSTTQTFSPNSIMGSVHYFSPEQAKGKLATEQSDIYSLGIVFYEMLTKHLPFDGESPISIALKHLQQTIPPASKYNWNVTANLQGILDKMLEKERSDRYQSVIDLLTDLRTWNVEGVRETTESVPVQELEHDPESTQVYTPVETKKKGINKTILSKLGLWAGIGLVLGGVIYLSILGFGALADFWRVSEVEVPNVVEKSLEDAIESLDAAGLSNYTVSSELYDERIPAGHVIRQSPSGGRIVKQNRTIELTVSKGPEMVEVPSLEGADRRAAETTLTGRGLTPDVQYETSEEVDANIVIRQDPLPGTMLTRGQEVILIVSSGPRPIKMPSLVGKTEVEALDIINDLGLRVRYATWDSEKGDSPGGIITSQDPEANQDVRPGDFIDYTLRPFNHIVRNVTVRDLNPWTTNLVRIEVRDISGETTVYEDYVSSQDTFVRTVSGYERGRITIYVNGALYNQENF